MTTERDSQTRIVLSWLREETHENAERVLLLALDEVDTTPQRRSWWPAWRTFHMNKLALAAAATTTVLAVAVIGYSLLPGLGYLGPGAAPSASPSLLARGTFDIRDWDLVEFEAIREGSRVIGTLTARRPNESSNYLRIDFRCVRSTEDGLIVIGGYEASTTSRTGGGFAAIALKRASPVKAQLWAYGPSLPAVQTTDCMANADAWSRQIRNAGDLVLRDDIDGTVEFGP